MVCTVYAAEFLRHLVEQLRHIAVLTPHRVTALTQVPGVLPPVRRRFKLGIHRRHERLRVETAPGKVLRDVAQLDAPLVPYRKPGVVHRRQRVHVLTVPAAVFVLAADAYAVRRPVENPRRVGVVKRLLDVAPDHLVHAGVRRGKACDPA